MADIPLREFAKDKTQAAAAKKIGVTQSALSQMLRSDRQIFVRTDSRGRVLGAYEIRPIGSKKPSDR